VSPQKTFGMNSAAERVLRAFWRRLPGKKIKGIN